MQLILLSGGSGKRLWPLSNNIRSKQFLQLLESPNKKQESMIQRVVRQIQGSNLTKEVTIVTNRLQGDIVKKQLGDCMNVVMEPERRNTFPAIALAAVYLARKKKCNRDETVVVMPCDVYTEMSYFSTISKMAEYVCEDKAKLILMGIVPTCPSEKFGYIVPKRHLEISDVFNVERFTEKPSTVVAKELLDKGAYWNGGVFAFKLGYIMDIVKEYMAVDSYKDVLSNYSLFPKISFDYQVVEKADSVGVVPFDGEWKDLGTWNSLCKELPYNNRGKVLQGDANENVHVINELDIPILCDGLKDIVIAASPDGIVISRKDLTERIKVYVDRLHEDQ